MSTATAHFIGCDPHSIQLRFNDGGSDPHSIQLRFNDGGTDSLFSHPRCEYLPWVRSRLDVKSVRTIIQLRREQSLFYLMASI